MPNNLLNLFITSFSQLLSSPSFTAMAKKSVLEAIQPPQSYSESFESSYSVDLKDKVSAISAGCEKRALIYSRKSTISIC